jgi:3,4-dihydroxy-2-butanone 4-phosphate synthase
MFNENLDRKLQHAPLIYSLSITNTMQRYTIFLITVNALHVSSGFSAHHQELKIEHTASGICQAATASGSSKQAETCRALTVIKNIV